MGLCYWGEMKKRNKRSLQLYLLAAITLTLVTTLFTKRYLEQRRAEALAQSPQAQLRRALDRVQMASFSSEPEESVLALKEALSTLKEILKEQPELKLFRSEWSLTRRLARAYHQAKLFKEAQSLREAALSLGLSFMDRAPSDEAGRRELLSTARELAEEAPPEAALAALSQAMERIKESLKGLRATDGVMAILASNELERARLLQGLKRSPEAVEALNQACRWAEELPGGMDPRGGLARQYNIVAKAARLAAEWSQIEEGNKHREALLKILDLRYGLQPKNPEILNALAHWHGEAADAAKGPEEALKHFAILLRHREALSQIQSERKKDWIISLNRVGAFQARRGELEEGLSYYRRAYELSTGRRDRSRLVIIGNLAQLLGRVDRIEEAKVIAAEAFELAEARLLEAADEPRRRVDAGVAALRHARLLRRSPKPKRREAQQLALRVQARLKGLESKDPRLKSVLKGLKSLLAEF